MAQSSFESLRGPLARALMRGKGPLSLAAIRPAFAEVAGDLVAQRAVPVALAGGSVTLRVNDARWRRELAPRLPALGEALRERLGLKFPVNLTFISEGLDPEGSGI